MATETTTAETIYARLRATKYEEYANEYVTLINGERVTQFEAAYREAKEAAEIAGKKKVTTEIVKATLDKNMIAAAATAEEEGESA